MLKNVVLPAPFGPIRLTIERSGMSKSTELTATRPPKILVMSRASRMLAGPLSVGDDPLRPQEHHDHEQDAEQEKVVLGDVRVAEGRAPDRVAYGVDPLVDLGQEVEVEALQGDRAQDDAVNASHAAQDDHGEDQNRDIEREARRKDILYERPVVRARQASEHSPHGVGPELGRHRVDAHCGGRRLILAHGDPGPSESGVPETYVHVDSDEIEDQYREVPRVQVQ